MRVTANPLRDQLRSVFSRAKLPTNPAIAVEILRLADDPDSTAEQFADVIRADPALAARLLEMANSASFAQREPVTTIKRAVTLMGLRRIRMAALGFQLVAHLDRLGGAEFDLKRFWQQSVLRACIARELAAKVVAGRAEEAFLIGLLQECGVLLLVQLYGQGYARLWAAARLSPTAFHEEEGKRFEHGHTETVGVLAAEWNLPESIAGALARHHQSTVLGPDSSDEDRLAAVSYLVGSLPLGGWQTVANSEPGLREYAELQLGLDAAALDGCLKRAGEAYAQVARLLAERLPETVDVTDLLEEANRHLSRAATEAESRVTQVEAERDSIRRQERQLRTALGQYREQASRDPLTRLLNRGALVEATVACMRECRERSQAIAVYFLDLDNFKLVNDEFGHHVGDEVLRVLAAAIAEMAVNGGFAARYGGEEFVLVIPGLSEEDAQRLAARMLERVRTLTMGGEPPPRPLTCSIGVVWGSPGPGAAPNALFTAADELMYEAKLGGKDRCCFRSLVRPASAVIAGRRAAAETAPREPEAPPGAGDAPPSVAELRRLAEELNRAEPRRLANMRKLARRHQLAACTVNSVPGGDPAVQGSAGCVRNVSTGGLGVLTTRQLGRGEPVEIVLEEGGQGPRYLGGLVAFCRQIGAEVFDVGIQLVARSDAPILARDGAPASQPDWVREALGR
jgi:diguanylate cyclase (GGDEF)-like protein